MTIERRKALEIAAQSVLECAEKETDDSIKGHLLSIYNDMIRVLEI